MTTMEEPLLKLMGAPQEGQFAVNALMIHSLLETRQKEDRRELRYVTPCECLRLELPTFPVASHARASRAARDNNKD